MKTRTCKNCGLTDRIETFPPNGVSYRTLCRECQRIRDRELRHKRNPPSCHHKSVSEIVYDDGHFCIIDVSTSKFPKAMMMVDSCDRHLFEGIVWSASERNGTIYARSSVGGKSTLAHRLIYPEYKMIDHINHNGLDNRRMNLRETNHKLNGRNRKRLENGQVYPGVCWNRFKSKWQVTIGVDNKNVRLGCFNDLSKAVMARVDGERKYWHEDEN